MSHLMNAYAEVAAAYGNVDPNDEFAVQRFFEVTFQAYDQETQQKIVDEIFTKSTGIDGSTTPSHSPTEQKFLRHSEKEAIENSKILAVFMGMRETTEDENPVTAANALSHNFRRTRIITTERYPREEPDELSPLEMKILRSIALGEADEDIARSLDVSEGAVKICIHNIILKLCDRQTLAALLQGDVKTSPLKHEMKETRHKT